jgi:hypothetical protein
MDRVINVINLGAGKGSTAVFMLAREGRFGPLDYAVFADTQEEPSYVYRHLAWLRSLGTPPILIGTAGKLGQHLIAGTDSAGNRKVKNVGMDGSTRTASIPAFTAKHHERRGQFDSCRDSGRVRRQCTKEYKAAVVERVIRREILGLKPRQRFPKDVQVVQWFGISVDEKIRARKITERFEEIKWAEPRFPLLEIGWRRGDCEDYLAKAVPHPVHRSACVF